MSPAPEFLFPDWRLPPSVRAAMTTRMAGVSTGPYASLNLAMHVGDDPAAVAENRRRVRDALELPAEPRWLTQVHGTTVAVLGSNEPGSADAAVAFEARQVCAVLLADCLPILLAGRDGDRVGIAHAGWRGLAAGVIESTVAALATDPADLVAWLGPAIGPAAFAVGAEVREALLSSQPDAAGAFSPVDRGRFLADLPALARGRLAACGIGRVHGGGQCTYSDPLRFYSYRRDGRTGRMAALLWLA